MKKKDLINKIKEKIGEDISFWAIVTFLENNITGKVDVMLPNNEIKTDITVQYPLWVILWLWENKKKDLSEQSKNCIEYVYKWLDQK